MPCQPKLTRIPFLPATSLGSHCGAQVAQESPLYSRERVNWPCRREAGAEGPWQCPHRTKHKSPLLCQFSSFGTRDSEGHAGTVKPTWRSTAEPRETARQILQYSRDSRLHETNYTLCYYPVKKHINHSLLIKSHNSSLYEQL